MSLFRFLPRVSRFSTTVNDALRIGVVGTGPAAFYTVKYLLKEIENVKIDMFDKLPTPYGLVRSGVAPDHPEVKSVQNDFAEVASNPAVRFFGNVELSKDVKISDLRTRYGAVVLAYGAESDRKLGLAGEQLRGVHSARDFVNWYNGHPQFSNYSFDLSPSHVVVIGQGNVAVDVGRILTSPLEKLQTTDIADHAIKILQKSHIKEVNLIGRRGPAQAAFTIKEVRELSKLSGTYLHIDKQDVVLGPVCQKELEQRPVKRKMDLLTEVANSPPPQGYSKTMRLKFFLAPLEILPDQSDPTRVGAVVFERTRLEGEPNNQKAVLTGIKETIKCGLVLRSIGYQSVAVPGIPFDTKKAVVPSERGRVVNLEGETEKGLYVSGWLKRGPTGIIGSNIVDAKETVKSIVEDHKLRKLQLNGEDIQLLLQTAGIKFVDSEGWNRINKAEEERGAALGKVREKIVHLADLVNVARGSK